MPTVHFTQALKRFFNDLDSIETPEQRISDILAHIDRQWPGIKGYIVDDQGKLRQHVNIFIDGELIQDREGLSDRLRPESEVYFFQALSGG
ncbi:MAG: MoaD/ThiS family protein [Saprospiraceae bacterium]|jgi:sulfur-carrier protein|nr:MoaD/ThiS family protein [Saprospiraceae bacterium]MDP4821449.1 MoaD/ThiS family protein [Saprospiraceae bacterium]MDP4999706.1 MoaD/ThiS family protein [Saprospiraceae bacterium]